MSSTSERNGRRLLLRWASLDRVLDLDETTGASRLPLRPS